MIDLLPERSGASPKRNFASDRRRRGTVILDGKAAQYLTTNPRFQEVHIVVQVFLTRWRDVISRRLSFSERGGLCFKERSLFFYRKNEALTGCGEILPL
jgi:hypothetical protein